MTYQEFFIFSIFAIPFTLVAFMGVIIVLLVKRVKEHIRRQEELIEHYRILSKTDSDWARDLRQDHERRARKRDRF